MRAALLPACACCTTPPWHPSAARLALRRCTHCASPTLHPPTLTTPTAHPQAEAEELRAELERMRTSLDGLKAAQNEYVKSAKKVQRVERKLADRQAAGKVGGGSLRPADMLGEVGRQ